MHLAMPDPVFPIDFSTVYLAVLLAGGTLLGLTFAVVLGFVLVRRMFTKLASQMGALDRPNKNIPRWDMNGKRIN